MPRFSEIAVEGGQIVTKRERVVKQSELSSECWLIQVWGKSRCETCEFKNTKGCGGQEIRETGINGKGFSVPLGGMSS